MPSHLKKESPGRDLRYHRYLPGDFMSFNTVRYRGPRGGLAAGAAYHIQAKDLRFPLQQLVAQ